MFHSHAVSADGTGPGDLLLVRHALRGQPDAVDRVLARLSCTVRFVYRLNQQLGYGLAPEALEDVVQQVYLAVWPRLCDFSGAAALESWVYGFCRNCLRTEVRRRAVGLRPLPNGDEVEPAEWRSPEQAIEQAEGANALWAELDRLPTDQREIVELRHLRGWSFEAIAKHQELPASTVKDRCYRALLTLKSRLKRRDVST